MSRSVRLARISRPTPSAILSTFLLLVTILAVSPAAARHAAPAPALSPARAPVSSAVMAALLLPRDYQDTVCRPPTQHLGDAVPPCVEIEAIETYCTPNGTGPLFLAAHQQCMCRGSYFADWPACLSCLFLHGLRSERDVGRYLGVIAAASAAFCDVALPTAEFATVFAAVQATAATPPTGATVPSDAAPGQTAVSLYYTPPGRQGPGQITGEATSATATALLTATRMPTTSQGGDDSMLGSQTQPAQGSGAGGNGSAQATGTPTNGSTPISSTNPDGAAFGSVVNWSFFVGAIGASVVLLL